MSDPRKNISIVVPVHNEAVNIPKLYQRLAGVMGGMPGLDWELVLVDDGSTDDSWRAISELCRANGCVRGICLARNFGKEAALTAGVESVGDADAVICMDADLQHPPEVIPDFIRAWESGNEIVVAIRETCADYTMVKKVGSRLFYAIMARVSDLDLSPNSTDFRLLDRKVIRELRRFAERTRIFRGLIDWMGFRKGYVSFQAPARLSGAPAYSYRKLVQLALNSFTSFSLVPLKLTGILGLAIILFSSLLLMFMVVSEFFWKLGITPTAYFVVLNTFLSGVLLTAIGLISLYIGHIHTEVISRPLYIVRESTLPAGAEPDPRQGR